MEPEFEYHSPPPSHHIPMQQQHSPLSHQLPPQAVQITPNHPHLRHVGHPQSSIICIQPNHHPPTIISNNQSSSASQLSVQSHNATSQQPNEQLHEMQISKKEHYHQANAGELRPSVIESNQPMVIECT
jgi:hypothetical protein